MNERIEELKRQAWDYAYDHETVKGNVANDGFINKNFSDEFSKKFAELIVQECVQAVADQVEEELGDREDNSWWKSAYLSGSTDAVRAFKQRFEVDVEKTEFPFGHPYWFKQYKYHLYSTYMSEAIRKGRKFSLYEYAFPRELKNEI
jgi:hypothetical protein